MPVTRSALARIRADLQNTIKLPKTSRNKLKPSVLCCWLSDLTAVLSNLLLDFRSVHSQLLRDGTSDMFNEAHIILQMNLTIRQLFPELFLEALRAHAEQAYKKWLKQLTSEVPNPSTQIFEACHKFGWTALYRLKYINMLHEIIEEKVGNLCDGEYQIEFLPDLRYWLDTTILPFAKTMLCHNTDVFKTDLSKSMPLNRDSSDTMPIQDLLMMQKYQSMLSKDSGKDCSHTELKNLLHNSLLHALSKSRAKELFEIVADFPDSVLAIKELKEAANGSSNLPHVGKSSQSHVSSPKSADNNRIQQ